MPSIGQWTIENIRNKDLWKPPPPPKKTPQDQKKNPPNKQTKIKKIARNIQKYKNNKTTYRLVQIYLEDNFNDYYC